jgi:hypothetical protein
MWRIEFTFKILTTAVFYMLTFMWSIGLNVTLVLFTAPPPPIGFGYSNLKIALMYIAPMVRPDDANGASKPLTMAQVAALLGEMFGHWFNDFVANRSIRKSGGTYEAEVRLWMLWLSTPFLVAGLVYYGFCLKDQLSWINLCIAWGFYQWGMVTATVAITGKYIVAQL